MRKSAKVAAFVGAAVALTLGGAGVVVALSGSEIDQARLATPMPRTNAANTLTQTAFFTIEPCRIANTKKSRQGILKPKKIRVLRVTGANVFSQQGGKKGGCDIPAWATAAVLSLATSNSSSAGVVTAFADGTKKPGTISLAHAKTPNSAEATVKLGTDGRIGIFSKARTHLTVDAVGYYAEPIAVLVTASGTVLSKSPQVTNVTKSGTGQYAVFTAGTRTQYCVASATPSNLALDVAAYTDLYAERVDVHITNNAGAYADGWFFLTVTC